MEPFEQTRPRFAVEDIPVHRAVLAVEGFMAFLSETMPIEQRDPEAVREETTRFIRKSIRDEEEARESGEDPVQVERDAFVYLLHTARLLWERNLLNQDRENQALLATTLRGLLYDVTVTLDPPLRRKVLTLCIHGSTEETPIGQDQVEPLSQGLRGLLEIGGHVSLAVLGHISIEAAVERLRSLERDTLGKTCRRRLLDSAPPTAMPSLVSIPAKQFTYAAMGPLLKLVRAESSAAFSLHADVGMILQKYSSETEPARDVALFEIHSYLVCQFERWMRALPRLYTIGNPGNLRRMNLISGLLDRCPGAQGLQEAEREIANVLSSLLSGWNDSGAEMFRDRVITSLEAFCLFEDLHRPVRQLDTAVYLLNEMTALARSLITKELSREEETRITTLLDAACRTGQIIQLGKEHAVTGQLEDLIPAFLICVLPATARGTAAWRRLRDELREAAVTSLRATDLGRIDAFLDGIKLLRQLERRQADLGSPTETMQYVSQHGGAFSDGDIRRIVEESHIFEQYDLFSRVYFPKIKDVMEAVKIALVREVDTSLESPFVHGRDHVMKDILEIQHPLNTIMMFFLTLGNILASRLIGDETWPVAPLWGDFLPIIGEIGTEARPDSVLERVKAITEKQLPCLMRLYPLTSEEMAIVVDEAVQGMDDSDLKVLGGEQNRQRLTRRLVFFLETALRENQRLFSPQYLGEMSYLRRIPAGVNPDIHAFFRSVLYPKSLLAALRALLSDLLEKARSEYPSRQEGGGAEERISKALAFYRARAEQTFQECAVLYDNMILLIRQCEVFATRARVTPASRSNPIPRDSAALDLPETFD